MRISRKAYEKGFRETEKQGEVDGKIGNLLMYHRMLPPDSCAVPELSVLNEMLVYPVVYKNTVEELEKREYIPALMKYANKECIFPGDSAGSVLARIISINALFRVAKPNDRNIYSAIVSNLGDSDPAIRYVAMICLMDREDWNSKDQTIRGVFGAVVGTVKEMRSEVQRRIVKYGVAYLSRMRQKAIPVLAEALRSDDSLTADTASAILSGIGRPAEAKLLDILKDYGGEELETRMNAARTLEALGWCDENLVSKLEERMNFEFDPDVKEAIRISISRLNAKKGIN